MIAAYLFRIRPWHLRWGATDADLARAMPGDEVVPRPSFNATRSVTIMADPKAIWPWLIQVGCLRGGWYSYDWIDNLGRSSAEEIIPALQDLEVGGTVPMSPDGKVGFSVELLEANRRMLWLNDDRSASWAWELLEASPGTTRLLTRVRMRYKWTWLWPLFNVLFDFGDFLMMRKMLLGVKWRAERLHRPGAEAAS